MTHSHGRPGGAEIRNANWIHTQVVTDRSKVDYLRAELDPGEAEVLVLAEQVSADWILLDEPKARLAAALLGRRFFGTIGLLLLAKQTDLVASVRPLLDELKSKGFFVSERVYVAALREATE